MKKNNKNIEYNYNVDFYKYVFIEEFLKVFPNIYTKEQLDKILRNNVRDIEYDPTIKNYNGRYIFNEQKIILRILKNNTIFHEFIHGVRGNEQIPEFYENVGIVEAFTAYAERIYAKCSRQNFEINYDKCKYVYTDDRKIKLETLPSYATLALLAQQIEFLNFLTGEEETILTTFLKRENIYNKIKNIYLKYYEKIDSNKTEEDAKKDTINLIIKINNVCSSIKENNLQDEDLDEDDIKEDLEQMKEVEKTKIINLFYAVNEIEKETENMFMALKQNHSVIAYNMLSITNHLQTEEEKLLYCIFGTETYDEIAIKQLLKTK